MDKPISIIIPALNEEGEIGETIRKIMEVFDSTERKFEVVVVDDGSTDDTGKRAEEAGATVIRHPANAGYGSALLSGIAEAKYELIGIIDGDGSYKAEDFHKLLEFSDDFDMVIGARTGVHYRGSFLKKPAREAFHWLAQYITGEKIPDVNSGMRIFKKKALENISHILCRGFSFSTTLTLNLLWGGCFVKFVPISYHKRVGRSHVRYLRDTLRTGQIMVGTLIYFNPIKIMLPLVLLSFFISLIFFLSWIFFHKNMWLLISVISFFSCLHLFGIGLIMDRIRMNK
jgi:glycosyltransferase involved in cell wall biosynthesis